MTTSNAEGNEPLFLGKTLEQWWAAFLAEEYVDVLELPSKLLTVNLCRDINYLFSEPHRLRCENTNYVCQALPCFDEAFGRKAIAAIPSLDSLRQARIVFSLGAIGPQTIGSLVEFLKHPSLDLRISACFGLVEAISFWYGDSRNNLELKLRYLRGPQLQPEALKAFFAELETSPIVLKQIDGIEQIVDLLLELLEDDYQSVRSAAIYALRRLLLDCTMEYAVRMRIIHAVVRRNQDRYLLVRLEAMTLLESVGWPLSGVSEEDATWYSLLFDYDNMANYKETERNLHSRVVQDHLSAIFNDWNTDIRDRFERWSDPCNPVEAVQNISHRNVAEMLQILDQTSSTSQHEAIIREEAMNALQWLKDQWVFSDPASNDEESRMQYERPTVAVWIQEETRRLSGTSLANVIVAIRDRDIARRLAAVDALVEMNDGTNVILDAILPLLNDPCRPLRDRADRAVNFMVRDKSQLGEFFGLDGELIHHADVE